MPPDRCRVGVGPSFETGVPQPLKHGLAEHFPRYGNMHHIGLGRPLDGTRIIVLIADLDIRAIHADTGEVIRTLTLDPNKRYHGTGRKTGGPTGSREP